MKQKVKDKRLDAMLAIKKADREFELEDNPGFKSKTKIHKSKKTYDRKRSKDDDFFE